MRKFNKTLLAMTTLLAASGANAAAFQLAEVSTSGLGRAYAGEAAIADNASVVATELNDFNFIATTLCHNFSHYFRASYDLGCHHSFAIYGLCD